MFFFTSWTAMTLALAATVLTLALARIFLAIFATPRALVLISAAGLAAGAGSVEFLTLSTALAESWKS